MEPLQARLARRAPGRRPRPSRCPGRRGRSFGHPSRWEPGTRTRLWRRPTCSFGASERTPRSPHWTRSVLRRRRRPRRPRGPPWARTSPSTGPAQPRPPPGTSSPAYHPPLLGRRASATSRSSTSSSWEATRLLPRPLHRRGRPRGPRPRTRPPRQVPSSLLRRFPRAHRPLALREATLTLTRARMCSIGSPAHSRCTTPSPRTARVRAPCPPPSSS
mmetsp:Transcript_19339/g.61337  ORF Transcript_19339/g.61337 Transcript_19339/m.61337 type:complete len:217 (+) Transcript_19339:798-1448(+)